MCNNLTPMGTVPISVIYGFEYSLNGFDQKSITKTKTLLDSEERKGFIQRQSAINKTRGCLKEIKGLRQNHIDKQTQTTGNLMKTKGCLSDIKTYQKAVNITKPERKGMLNDSKFFLLMMFFLVNLYKEKSLKIYTTNANRFVYNHHILIPNKSWYWKKRRFVPQSNLKC